jgi:hypothetical protein
MRCVFLFLEQELKTMNAISINFNKMQKLFNF